MAFALALGVPLAVAHGPLPGRSGAASPVELASELATLANRGSRASWIVTFAFTRTTPAGGVLHSTVVVGHRPPIDVESGLGSTVITVGDRSYSCTEVDGQQGAQCLPATASGTARPGDVYGGAVVSGRYDIRQLPATHLAGHDAHCFELRLRTGTTIAGLGFRTQQCYSDGGVPLRSYVERPGGTDERVAQVVRAPAGRADLDSLLSSLGLDRFVSGS